MRNITKEKKAVITILGTIGGYCDKNDPTKGIYNDKAQSAKYNSSIEEIEDTNNINTLPILIKTFTDYEVISLYTPCARDIQAKVLEKQNINYTFDKEWEIDDDMEFDNIFSKIDGLINSYDKVIIDVSHGYRHLPILMIVNTIMHNIESINKIEKILFAKEIKKDLEYEIIDLKRYLDLANISYALTTFDRNYTVANNIKISDKELNEFLENLSNFSKHILANSIDELLRDTNKQDSIVTRLIVDIKKLLNSGNTIFSNLKRLLEQTLKHLETIKSYENEIHFIKLYNLSLNMKEKGYYLNSITLLSEAIGMYCSLALKNTSDNAKNMIETYEKNAFSEKNNENTAYKLYELYNQSKTLYKVKPINYRGTFLKVDTNTKNNKYKQKLLLWNDNAKKLTESIKENIIQNETLKELIIKIDNLRNNLAHANSSKRLKTVAEDIKEVLNDFKELCIEKDILSAIKNS